jgi:hypothetical protein
MWVDVSWGIGGNLQEVKITKRNEFLRRVLSGGTI